MKLYHKAVFLVFCLLAAALTVYSYALVDPNLTLVNSGLWVSFREAMINLGYYQRNLSANIYLVFVFLLFILHILLVRNYKRYKFNHVVIPLIFIGLFSYPFLSHDFFNYLFDAKIATFYHKNPYFYKGLDFPGDPWLRFMHWTHRTYPYGPSFLLITLVPSFLSFGKFILAFLFFKAAFISLFVWSVYLLNKLNKKWAIMFATNPLVIIEGLVNSHNDLMAVSLAIIGIYYLLTKRYSGLPRILRGLPRIVLVLSGLIKYLTLPLIFLSRKNKRLNLLVSCGVIALILYVSFTGEIQPWYFLSLLILIPFYEDMISDLNIFFAGLLFSYDPYIRLGGWDTQGKLDMKHQIIAAFFILNVIYLIVKRLSAKFLRR